jgi:hypothetical protein
MLLYESLSLHHPSTPHHLMKYSLSTERIVNITSLRKGINALKLIQNICMGAVDDAGWTPPSIDTVSNTATASEATETCVGIEDTKYRKCRI